MSLISGGAGTGKTVIAGRVAAAARASGWPVTVLDGLRETVPDALSGGILDVIRRTRAEGRRGGRRGRRTAAVRPGVLCRPDPAGRLHERHAGGPGGDLRSGGDRHPFDDEEEGVALANDSEYGLIDYVWSGDVARAFRVARRLRAGGVGVNTVGRNMEAPFGGGSSGAGWGAMWGRTRCMRTGRCRRSSGRDEREYGRGPDRRLGVRRGYGPTELVWLRGDQQGSAAGGAVLGTGSTRPGETPRQESKHSRSVPPAGMKHSRRSVRFGPPIIGVKR